jgi:hypothetical protein
MTDQTCQWCGELGGDCYDPTDDWDRHSFEAVCLRNQLAAVTEDMELFRDRAKRWNIKCQDDAKEITRLRGLLGEIEKIVKETEPACDVGSVDMWDFVGVELRAVLDRINEGGKGDE